jgi:CubicO group peptidase (beta-lactamase class C family)
MLALAAALASAASSAQDIRGTPLSQRARAVEDLLQTRGDDALRQFIEQHVAPKYRDSFRPDELMEKLRKMRDGVGEFGGVLFRPVGDDGLRIALRDGPRESTILFRIEPEPPFRIVFLDFEGTHPVEGAGEPSPPYMWDTLAARLDEEGKNGFSGTVLVVRDRKIFLHQGYGLANREKNIQNSTSTIYAIGSVPIDFTKGAVLKLEEMGKLKTSDPVAMYLPDVPEDKSSMTIDQLMHGSSGLPDFHDVRGVDEDPDLSWIDRGTAIRRILGRTLLFPPGQGRRHSHSAWVLLAAIVEIVSGKPYGAFLRTSLFEPAGMTDTGLHEDAERIPDDRFAVGYEGKSAGKVNTPKHWGRTSWLVMGSGGMYSTPLDLYRWMEGIRSGRTLAAPAAAKYWSGGVLAGGDQRGYFCIYTEGPADLAILCSNAHSMRNDRATLVGERVVRLVHPGGPPG